jgi:hypothetical protein
MLFLGIASISGYMAWGMRAELATAQAALDSANKSASKTQRLTAALSSALAPEGSEARPAGSLIDRVSIFNTKAQASRINHRVAIASVSSSSDVLGGAETLPGTRVQSIRLVYRGTTSSYAGLLGWVSGLREMGGAIAAMRVKGTEFEVAVRLYGMGS